MAVTNSNIGLELVTKDPVSGRWKYLNTSTDLFELSDTPPTPAQVQQYLSANPEDPPQKWWGPLPGYKYPPDPPLTQDNAKTQLTETPQAPPASTTDGGTLSESETQNLNSAVSADNPDAGDPLNTGKVTNEATVAENGNSSTLNEMSWTGPLPEDQSNNPNADNTAKNTDTPTNTKPIPNRLHQYPTYIYGLSLHLLSDIQYNKVVEQQIYTPTNVLIASAGRYSSDTFPRNPFFSEDFYFDDCTITSIIAPNDVSRNTNAIDTSFTIIEPYGFTLVERLLKAADAIRCQNYLDMPYLLQVDFFALGEDGTIKGSIEDLRKRIPIKINTMDIKISTKGTEYRITAVPFNHSAYDTTSVTTPANFEITAKTVSEFFQSVEGTEADTFVQALSAISAAQREASAPKNTTPSGTVAPPGSVSTNPVTSRINSAAFASGALPIQATMPSVSPAPVDKTNTGTKDVKSQPAFNKVKSYGTAINAWTRALKETNKISQNDIYRFEFPRDPKTGKSIGDAAFTDILRTTPKETPMKDNKSISQQISMRRANTGENQNIYDADRALFQVQYGTTIEKLLEYIIRNSDYIQEQLVIADGLTEAEYQRQKDAVKTKPLRWFKIVPTVRLLDFDERRKIWQREITYTVKPYLMYNIRSEVGPQGIQLYPVKNYNYIYTGKNDDVFDFDITFNALYYMQATAYRDNLSELSPTGASLTTNFQYQNAPNYKGGEPPKGTDYNAVMPLTMKPQVQNSRAVATGGASTARETAAADLNDSLLTTADYDMVNIKLKILGDPDYIKQDDVFYRPPLGDVDIGIKPSIDPRLLPNNSSLVMDDGGLYIQLVFRTPTDIDEKTGMMKFDPVAQHSVFSGLYMVISVSSTFSQGEFTQELDLVRLPRQVAYDYVNLQNNKSDQRNNPADQNLTPNSPLPAPDTSSISVGASDGAGGLADASDTSVDQTEGKNQDVVQIQSAEPGVETPTQADLRTVRDTAPTQTIDVNTRPPQLGNDATDAQLAENYRQKAVYLENQAKKSESLGLPASAAEERQYAEQYREWAARRQALADGTSNQ